VNTERDTSSDLRLRTIPARELKRRGIAWLDKDLIEGPVHVIRNDEPCYVIMREAQYQDFLEDAAVAELVRVKQSLQDYNEGRFTASTAEELIQKLGLE